MKNVSKPAVYGRLMHLSRVPRLVPIKGVKGAESSPQGGKVA